MMTSSLHTPTFAPVTSKRKRSVDESFSSDDSGCPHSRGMVDIQPGRTLKRWRNGKPREEEVYQYTLQKLFSAQSSQPSHTPTTSSPFKTIPTHPPGHNMNSTTPTGRSQRALTPPQRTNPFAIMAHTKPISSNGAAFSKLMPCTSVAASSQTPEGMASCEDCDRAMELSGFSGMSEEGRCGACSKRVCENGCSISLGDGARVCLDCAMKS
ncbi:hypothetical protein L873DRAFT_185357 [Choiromyces venosus 120613-1]|uniref:Uncharacterized protein n=1 Tax=Choiromyces venosus 120613-1 TaxID=1336337 RepID=A0A3N4J2J5_9PEZI|nr:hypothetical protein L873DRAFT_185357 [Choiromyces venosus 120613-1]